MRPIHALALLCAFALAGCAQVETTGFVCRTDAALVVRSAADLMRRDGFRVDRADEGSGEVIASKRGFAAWLPASRRSGATVWLDAEQISPGRVRITAEGTWRPFPYIWTIGCHPAQWVSDHLIGEGFEPL